MTNRGKEYESLGNIGSACLPIHTPEGVLPTIELSGPINRCMALSLDLSVVYTFMFILKKFLGLIFILNIDIAEALGLFVYFISTLGYHIMLERYWGGQTVGKRLFHIRVMDSSGLRLGFGQIVVRNLLRTVDILPAFYMFGGFSCALDKKKRRLGDIAASTVVAKVSKAFTQDMNQLLPEKYNSFREFPHLEARLMQRVSPKEAALALKALLRSEQLQPDTRIVIFKHIANHLILSVPFPRKAVEGISHEKYVRNAVDILFNGKTYKKTEI